MLTSKPALVQTSHGTRWTTFCYCLSLYKDRAKLRIWMVGDRENTFIHVFWYPPWSFWEASFCLQCRSPACCQTSYRASALSESLWCASWSSCPLCREREAGGGTRGVNRLWRTGGTWLTISGNIRRGGERGVFPKEVCASRRR